MSAASSNSSDLYQRVILEHNRSPKRYGRPPQFTHQALGTNPICGDEVSVFLTLDPSGHELLDLAFTAQSCALCRASASIMCDSLFGLSLEAAHEKTRLFKSMIQNNGLLLEGDVSILAVTREFPARAKCVLLPWMTFLGALSGQVEVSTLTSSEALEV